jgi:hypothetical protein
MRTTPPGEENPPPDGAAPDRAGVVLSRLGSGLSVGAASTAVPAALIALSTTERIGMLLTTTLLGGICPLLWAAARRRRQRRTR